uniref:Uncharacterized protein n=1 Tax=Anopheles dirus TaxID=7168 RepID=A0A182NXS3_9DIPT
MKTSAIRHAVQLARFHQMASLTDLLRQQLHLIGQPTGDEVPLHLTQLQPDPLHFGKARDEREQARIFFLQRDDRFV